MAVANRVIGAPAPRIDGADKVTGRAQYTADVKLPGTLWGKALRSPYPHAKIVHIDTTRAEAVPGVHAVVTGADIYPGARHGRALMDIPVLAQGVVRFVGEQVAAVAAVDEETAQRALELIEVEYEELPAVFDTDEAMEPGAPLLHPDMLSYKGYPKPLEAPSNRYTTFEWGKGDVEAGLAEADVIVENTFRVPRQHQGYFEPHTCLVHLDEQSRLHVWVGNKSPHPGKRILASVLQMPEDQVVFNPVTIGGDFGGKGSLMQIPVAYLLAKKTGRAIRMALDYSEDLMAANPRHAAVFHVRTGVKRDGMLTAHEVVSIYDSGAYGGFKPGGHLGGAASAGGPYHVPHGKVVEHQVYTNNVPCGYMRGPGEPQAMFAVESQMDCVARAIGMDPVEFRRKNLIRDDEADTIGNVYKDVRGLEVLEEAVKASGYGAITHHSSPLTAHRSLRYGRGIAVGERSQGGGQTQASVTLNVDGSVVVHTSVFEQGSGSYTVMQQIVADELGLPAERVTVRVWDTSASPGFDNGIGGSRVTRMAGKCVHEATQAVKAEAYKLTAELLGWPEDRLRVQGDDIVRTDTGESAPWAGVLARTGAPVTGYGAVNDTAHNPYTSFTAQVAEVAVDVETGQVKLVKITTVHDTGTIFNPIGFQGQVNGGLVQGIGYGLCEELVVEDGRVTTLSLADYKLPNIADIPELRTVVLKAKEGYGPYQIKGIGEHSNAQTAPAIANAVEDAVGVRIRDLPVTAEKVYRALLRKD